MASSESVEIVRRAFQDAESNDYEASAELRARPQPITPDYAQRRQH
jgi:hypothetical protein